MPETSAIGSDVSRHRRWVRVWQIIVVLFVATYYKDLRRRLAQDFQYRMGIWPRRHIFTDDLFGSIYLVCQCWAWQLWSFLVGGLFTIIVICVVVRTHYLVPAVVALACAWLPHMLIWGIMLYYVFVVRLEVKLAWEAERLEAEIRRLELAHERLLHRVEEGSMSAARFGDYLSEDAPHTAQPEQAADDSHVEDLDFHTRQNNRQIGAMPATDQAIEA